MQKRAAKAGCTEGLCDRAGCKEVVQDGIAIGRGSWRNAKRDAQRRSSRGRCKAVLEMQGAPRGFAMGGWGGGSCREEM